jgi:hypothetical protein
MSDFSDRPFVAGSLFGLRAFRIDPLGRLTGVTHRDVWTPGQNAAVCHRPPYKEPERVDEDVARKAAEAASRVYSPGGLMSMSNYYTTYAQLASGIIWPGEPNTQPKDHSLAATDCACGFYAYFDGNDYLDKESWIDDGDAAVGAVVEGWGVCTVGSRGFRASKARIVALIDPDGDSARTIIAFEKVRRAYPDVPVFESERDAIRAFPLSEPLSALPSDEDFWTRSA